MKLKKTIKWSLVLLSILFFVFALYVVLNTNLRLIASLPDESYIALDDLEYIKNDYGKFVDVKLEKDEIAVGEDKYKSGNIVFKLFGLFKIKEVSTQIIADEEVFLGGNPVGFAINTEGVIVVGTNKVLTTSGAVAIADSADIKIGDIIKSINGKNILSASDFALAVNECGKNGESVKLNYIRDEKIKNCELRPVLDSASDSYKLGIWVRDDASGVGTLTFVDDKMNFGALGHPISDSETGSKIDVAGGKLYNCSIVGIVKGEYGTPGQIRAVILESKKNKGEITKNTNFGLFGEIEDKNGLVDENKRAKVGGRMMVKPGKAKLVSSISGVREEYDIEIIKASSQKSADNKSLVVKVTDKRLLELTGGIVQGMSGSPILQNGKIIGAITHVFVSDPTKGYGVYIDWMLI